MKKLSIKMRVTLWYTGLIVIIMALVLAFILASSDKVVLFNMKNQLKSTVKESMEDIKYKQAIFHYRFFVQKYSFKLFFICTTLCFGIGRKVL